MASASCSENQSTETTETRKLILSINAANSALNYKLINSLSGGSSWEVREAILDNFGAIMNEQSFTAALDHSYPLLKQTLEELQPDVLLASSKGVGVIAYLASKKHLADIPIILFSPIPNPIDGLVRGDSYEMEWSDTISVIRQHNLGPVLVVAGSSTDEEMLITQALQEPSVCGEVSVKTGLFEKCADWRHVVVPGDHGWRALEENKLTVSKLIDYMVTWMEKKKD